jgi:elongation factor G
MSIATSLAYAEWNKSKINFLDTPGFNMFVHEAKMAMPAVEAAVVAVDGVSGVEVVTEKVWQYADEHELPRIVVASRMDRERADYNRVLESVTSAFGRSVAPVQLPIGSEKNLKGLVDLVRMKSYTYEMGGSGKGKEDDIPADMQDAAQAANEKLVELIAEGNDALMEEFFEKGALSPEQIVDGIKQGVREMRLFPVMCAAAGRNIGADLILNFIVENLPSPVEREGLPAEVGQDHAYLAPVVGVDRAGGVEAGDPVPDGQPTARAHLDLEAGRNGHGDARRHAPAHSRPRRARAQG